MQEWKVFLVPLAALLSLSLAGSLGGHSIHDWLSQSVHLPVAFPAPFSLVVL